MTKGNVLEDINKSFGFFHKLKRYGVITVASLTFLASLSTPAYAISHKTIGQLKKVSIIAEQLHEKGDVKGTIDEKESKELRKEARKFLKLIKQDIVEHLEKSEFKETKEHINFAVEIAESVRYDRLANMLREFYKTVDEAHKLAALEFYNNKFEKEISGYDVQGKGWGANIKMETKISKRGFSENVYIQVYMKGEYRILNKLPVKITDDEVKEAVKNSKVSKEMYEEVINEILKFLKDRKMLEQKYPKLF